MAESLSLPRIDRRFAPRAPAPAAPAVRRCRRLKAWIDRVAVAVVVISPPAALLGAWLGWMPHRSDPPAPAPESVRQAEVAIVE